MAVSKIKIVWREYYNPEAVKQLTAMGTLPRNEAEIDEPFEWEDGEDIAAEVAKVVNDENFECFREDGETIVILEPEKYAGTYRIGVEYEPRYSASKSDLA